MHTDITVVYRPKKGVMAWLFRRAMPQDTRPTFVWSRLVTEIENAGYFNRLKFSILAVGLIIMTIATIKMLLFVPGLNQSVVSLLTRGLETFLPTGWATATAWTVGMSGVFLMGDFTNYTISYCSSHYWKSKLFAPEARGGTGAKEFALACVLDSCTSQISGTVLRRVSPCPLLALDFCWCICGTTANTVSRL